jgi:hypothetical protein
MADSRGEVSLLLVELKSGRKDALERLLPLVYGELRRLAGRYMRDERPNHTFQPTALVAMGISGRTVEREWALAKAWLRTQLAAV